MTDYLKGIDLGDLDNSFSGSSSSATPPSIPGVDLSDLDQSFGHNDTTPSGLRKVYITKPDETKKPDDISTAVANPDIIRGLWQGVKDIPATGAQAIGAIDRAVSKVLPTSGAERADAYDARLKAENDALPVDNAAFDVGRTGGQILATAPLMPTSAFRAVAGASKAVPYVGKLAGLVANGGLAGGIYGAATNSTNDNGLASNVGTNAALGAVAGPVAETGMQVAGKAVTGAQNIIRSLRTNNILKGSGIDPNAARNTLSRLTDAGYTPDQAHAAVQAMGLQATLGDLTEGLATEASGLAAKGGVPTEILKGRYGERAAGANSAANDIMENNLGPKPDFEIEKKLAADDRKAKTSADYNAAYNTQMALDVRPVIKNITDKLENAVGPEAARLKDIGSYLFKNDGSVKVDTAPLHAVRKALDDLLDKLPKEGTSQTSHTYRSLSDVREELDKVLKTNPDMAIADAKFAKLAEDAHGMDIGKQAIEAKGSFEKFEKEWKAASPEKQEFIRKGLRIQLGDKMLKASRGELSEAQRLFGKSTDNRNIIKLAFGQNGEEVLDALAKEARFRSVETQTMRNAETASRHAVQARPEYGGGQQEGHYLTPVASGLALDLATGTPGLATATGAGKGVFQGIKERLNKEKVKNTIEGTADLLSRQAQHGRTTAMDLLDRVGKIRGNNSKLAVDYSGFSGITVPATIPTIKRGRQKLSDLIGISQQ